MTCTLQGTIVRLENELIIVGLQQAENPSIQVQEDRQYQKHHQVFLKTR